MIGMLKIANKLGNSNFHINFYVCQKTELSIEMTKLKESWIKK